MARSSSLSTFSIGAAFSAPFVSPFAEHVKPFRFRRNHTKERAPFAAKVLLFREGRKLL
jgi:hypothetical protein